MACATQSFFETLKLPEHNGHQARVADMHQTGFVRVPKPDSRVPPVAWTKDPRTRVVDRRFSFSCGSKSPSAT